MANAFQPRRLLDDDNPNGYMESDLDFALNNWDLVLEFLDNHISNDKIMTDKDMNNE